MWNVADVDGEVISVTLDTGERVYCGIADAAEPSEDLGAARGVGQRSGQLLARPISELLRNAEDAAVARAVLASDEHTVPTPASAAAPGERRRQAVREKCSVRTGAGCARTLQMRLPLERPPG